MKMHARTALAAVVATMLLCPVLPVGAPLGAGSAMAQTAPAKAGWYPHQVDMTTVKQYVVTARRDVTLVDARPAARKYDVGHIPTAINIPDSQFDQLAPKLLLPDKAQLVIFYCDGPECILSHQSAFKAEKLGYTNVRVYAGGFPEWVKAGNVAAVRQPPVSAAAIVAGKEPGTIAVESFERIYREAPGTVHLIDVREPHEFAAGTFKGAVNMPVATLDKNLDKLPSGKPIVFFCGAGGRSGEAHDLVKASRPELKTVFIDAKISWTSSGEYVIAAK
jgi:rhodanese-related sulfurtransferase